MNNAVKLLMASVLMTIALCAFTVCTGATSGTCGETLTWELNNGVLTITGKGEMAYFEGAQDTPWYSDRQSVTEVCMEDGITKIGNSAFQGLSALKKVNIPETVTQIAPHAFRDCSELTDIAIPEGVTLIGGYAFAGCTKLTGINIPQSVTMIHSDAFYDAGCIKDEANNIDGAIYLDNCLIELTDKSVENFVIQDGTRLVADEVFFNMKNLKTVLIPDSVQIIGDAAFFICENLEYAYYEGSESEWNKVKIGVGNTELDNILWFVKDGIKWRLSEGILTIEGTDGMSDWTQADIPWENEKSKIKKITATEGITVIGMGAFMDCTELEDVSLPNGLYAIEANAFNNCSKLSNVEIPDSVELIRYSAFRNCKGLKTLNIPEGVHYIEYAAFAGCSGLETVTLPNSLTYIDGLLFGNCTALKNIHLRDGLKIIGENAFSGCTNLEKIVFPESLLIIKSGAFNASGITDVYYKGTKNSWEQVTIETYNELLLGANIHFFKVLGDANMDGLISVVDAVAILKSVAGITELNWEQKELCDVNADKNITVSDALKVLKYIARIESTL